MGDFDPALVKFEPNLTPNKLILTLYKSLIYGAGKRKIVTYHNAERCDLDDAATHTCIQIYDIYV